MDRTLRLSVIGIDVFQEFYDKDFYLEQNLPTRIPHIQGCYLVDDEIAYWSFIAEFRLECHASLENRISRYFGKEGIDLSDFFREEIIEASLVIEWLNEIRELSPWYQIIYDCLKSTVEKVDYDRFTVILNWE